MKNEVLSATAPGAVVVIQDFRKRDGRGSHAAASRMPILRSLPLPALIGSEQTEDSSQQFQWLKKIQNFSKNKLNKFPSARKSKFYKANWTKYKCQENIFHPARLISRIRP